MTEEEEQREGEQNRRKRIWLTMTRAELEGLTEHVPK